VYPSMCGLLTVTESRRSIVNATSFRVLCSIRTVHSHVRIAHVPWAYGARAEVWGHLHSHSLSLSLSVTLAHTGHNPLQVNVYFYSFVIQLSVLPVASKVLIINEPERTLKHWQGLLLGTLLKLASLVEESYLISLYSLSVKFKTRSNF
jgi:hypothetical protein